MADTGSLTVSTLDNTAGNTAKGMSTKKILCCVAIVIIVIGIMYFLYKYRTDGYIVEPVRSDSDREGWDLRKSIERYLHEQNTLLSKRLY